MCNSLVLLWLLMSCKYVFLSKVRASFLKALGFKQAARKQKSVFALNPVAAINSMAASGFRRLSGARRGSLEPLAASEDGGSNGLGLTAQQVCIDLELICHLNTAHRLKTYSRESDFS